MIEIDGEYGSGGGQVLRTAVGLSALTGKPCRVTNIRAKRTNPGLREQHVQGIRAVADRQAQSAARLLSAHFGVEPDIEIRYADAICPGSGIQVWAETADSVIGGNALGERGKRSEDVGSEAAKMLIEEFEGGAVDCPAGQLLLCSWPAERAPAGW